jgi:hypothetical protein
MSTPTIGNASRRTMAPCGDYSQAQQVVDSLADRRFPVENVSIVGSDLRLVEQVISRLATARAAPAVAASGAWNASAVNSP